MLGIKHIAIIGAGMMGKMCAFVFASAYKVGVYDIAPQDLIGSIRESTKELVYKGVMTSEEVEARLSRIRFTQEMDDDLIAKSDLLIEAVFEDMELKQKVFAELEEICRPDCIFCTNTSVMSPSEISKHLKYRKRFAATHFWNPAHLIPLVEVVMSDATAPEVAQTLMDILEEVGKKPVLCRKDVPGFIANRLQHALWREAIYMVENGIADPKTVDDACKYGPGLRWPVLGPMENSDLVGIDLTYNIHNYVLKHLADNHEPSHLLKEMMDKGTLGMKSGMGWQQWAPEQIEALTTGLREYLVENQKKNEK
ncbi:MAG: 3-hydroxyacyl-CoA dehydrogenase family protein [Oscillospiraceae bacterium]|nr:3-hydroxyacyl-CoA dehydrogenase family protein [Oscillospiraceae bacterium]